MPADAFSQKQQMMEQLQAQQEQFKSRMAGLPLDKRQHFLQQQQLVIAQMQSQVRGAAGPLCTGTRALTPCSTEPGCTWILTAPRP